MKWLLWPVAFPFAVAVALAIAARSLFRRLFPKRRCDAQVLERQMADYDAQLQRVKHVERTGVDQPLGAWSDDGGQ